MGPPRRQLSLGGGADRSLNKRRPQSQTLRERSLPPSRALAARPGPHERSRRPGGPPTCTARGTPRPVLARSPGPRQAAGEAATAASAEGGRRARAPGGRPSRRRPPSLRPGCAASARLEADGGLRAAAARGRARKEVVGGAREARYPEEQRRSGAARRGSATAPTTASRGRHWRRPARPSLT